MIPTRILERRSMRGLTQSTHISYVARDDTHTFQKMVILRGEDLCMYHGEPIIRQTGLWNYFPNKAHADKDFCMISYSTMSGEHNIKLFKTPTSTSCRPLDYHPVLKKQYIMQLGVESALHDLHRDSVLMPHNLSRIDLETGKIRITQKKHLSSLVQDMPYSLVNSAHWGPHMSQRFMLPLSPNVKMLTTINIDTLAITDFRDCKNTASEWVCRTDGAERCQGYRAGVKAHCKAFLCTGLGDLVSVDRGVINTRCRWIPDSPESSRRWEPPEVITAGEIPEHARRPSLAYYLRGDGNIKDLHALSDVSPVVAVIGKNRSTRLYDVKREELLAYVSQDYIQDAVPIFCDGFPQLVGINRSTHKLEIVA